MPPPPVEQDSRPKRPLPPIPSSLPQRQPLEPITTNSHIVGAKDPLEDRDPYYEAAQRLITLETRFPTLSASPSASSSSSSSRRLSESPISRLKEYGSTSYSDKASPVSLPSKAKRWIRGPARRAPPNTPTSQGWGIEEKQLVGGDQDEDEEESRGKCLDEEHSTRRLDEEYPSRRQTPTVSFPPPETDPDSSISSTQPSSTSSTPSPISPASLSDSIANLAIDRIGHVNADTNTGQEGSGRSVSRPDLSGPSITQEAKEAASSSVDLVLEGIAAELGADVSLGYEIRSFRWDR